MKELSKVRQIPGESKRRWFASQDFDLIVWLAEDQSFSGFELCYDKLRNERSIVWSKTGGFRHRLCGNPKTSAIISKRPVWHG